MLSDAIHRGSGQIIPAARRVCYAAVLLAAPALQEPVYSGMSLLRSNFNAMLTINSVEIQCPEDAIDGVRLVLEERQVRVFNEKQSLGNTVFMVEGHIPVTESFGLDEELYSATGGKVINQLVFDRWSTMVGSPFERGGRQEEIVTKVRMRKGLEVGFHHVLVHTRY
jgi:elongation factor 2